MIDGVLEEQQEGNAKDIEQWKAGFVHLSDEI